MVLILVGVAVAMVPSFGRSFLPEFHEGNFIVVMSTLPGTSLDESMRLGYRVRERLLNYPQVVSVSQRAGRSELDEDAQPPNFSEFDVKLDYDRDKRMPPDELLRRIRSDLSDIPGAIFNVGQFISHRMDEILSGVRAQVAIKIYGDDLNVLRQKGQEVLKVMQTVKGVEDLMLEQQIQRPQVTIKIDREKAGRYGLKAGGVGGRRLRRCLMASPFPRCSKVRSPSISFVRLQDKARSDLESIRNILVDAPALQTGRRARRSENPPAPGRGCSIRGATVFHQPRGRAAAHCRLLQRGGRDLNSLIVEAQKKIGEQVVPKLPSGYFIQYGGQFESQQQAQRILILFGIGAVVGIFLMLFQAFGTTREALLVMLNLPLALIGGVIAIFLTGRDLSVPAMIGFISLFGIASRNGIILVSHYNQLRKEGKSLRETDRRLAGSSQPRVDDRSHRRAGSCAIVVGRRHRQRAGAPAGPRDSRRPVHLDVPEHDCHPDFVQQDRRDSREANPKQKPNHNQEVST